MSEFIEMMVYFTLQGCLWKKLCKLNYIFTAPMEFSKQKYSFVIQQKNNYF